MFLASADGRVNTEAASSQVPFRGRREEVKRTEIQPNRDHVDWSPSEDFRHWGVNQRLSELQLVQYISPAGCWRVTYSDSETNDEKSYGEVTNNL